MKRLVDSLIHVAEDNTLTAGAKSIEQKQRNLIKKELTEALADILGEALADNPTLALYRTKDGLMIGVDNAKVGIIPLEFKIAVKNLDVDPQDLEDEYKEHIEEQKEKKAKAARIKAEKIARQAEERELRQKLKEAKKATESVDTDDLD